MASEEMCGYEKGGRACLSLSEIHSDCQGMKRGSGDLNLEVRYLYPSLKNSRNSGPSARNLRVCRAAAERTGYSKFLLIVAGTPTASLAGGMSLVTTAPAPVIDPSPTVTGATSIVSHPMNASSSTTVRCLSLPS